MGKTGALGKPALVRAACHAMGTRFEMLLYGTDETRLRAAAAEVTEEILRVHAQLNLFDPASEVAALNRQAACAPVRTDARLLTLIERCRELWRRTHGAFDITVGALMRKAGFRGDVPQESSAVWGMDGVETDLEAGTVFFTQPGIELDFGGVAKGYALDLAAEQLRECRVSGALIHGGTSSVLAVGSDPEGKPWRVGLRDPSRPAEVVHVVELADTALGVSAVYGRMRECGGRPIGHVMNPLRGEPAAGLRLAAVSCPSALDADALATAVLVLGEPLAQELRQAGLRVWIAAD